MNGGRVTRLMRRVWWALLPYHGWTYGTREQRKADEADGAIPPPWYAFPLAAIFRRVDYWLVERDIDKFGPKHNAFRWRVGEPIPRPWE